MNRILKIGMDVHSTNYNLCVAEPKLEGEPDYLYEVEVEPDYLNIIKVITNLRKKYKDDTLHITCGYEAGCLGYKLYHQLDNVGIKCVILAPSTMEMPVGKVLKTDKRDARGIAKCLANGGYSAVHVPTAQDEEIRDYLRMRDDHKKQQKITKQTINAFCLRHGFKYTPTKWTGAHLKWLKELPLSEQQRETLDEYLLTYNWFADKISRLDARIEELAAQKDYVEKVNKLRCFIGIKTQEALSLIVETGNFSRFSKGNIYSAFIGLTPGEHSSSTDVNRLSITKAGNKHIRTVLVEAAQCICRGRIGAKSKNLQARQRGNAPSVIAYADKANERLRRKYYRMLNKGKQRNVAVTAVARELACFIWGMMTDNIA
jgi:transposase